MGKVIELDYREKTDTTGEVMEPVNYMNKSDSDIRIYSIDDFDEMPEEPRYELQDGVLITMEAPLIIHQRVVTEFATQVGMYIRRNKGKCTPLVSPVAVQPDLSDEHTLFQPDFIVVCDPDKLTDGRHVRGGPDWVVEVLSESTRKRDMTIKRDAYKKAGVREYWMVDIEGEVVIIYDFTRPDVSFVKDMRKPIPVGIFDGELSIELGSILEPGDELRIQLTRG